VYRRALAPTMVWNGVVGVIGGFCGWVFRLDPIFILFWSGLALLSIAGSFLLVRKQALRDSEPFWSPPTRRIAQALLPPLCIGAFINVASALVVPFTGEPEFPTFLIAVWLWLYGCAAHAAGFFMTRGMKLFGWMFIAIGCCIAMALFRSPRWAWHCSPFLLMGTTFGGLHLVYGIYLYLTEKGKNAA